MTASAANFASARTLRKACSNAQAHHFNAADGVEDFDCSTNVESFGDVSAFLASLHSDLRGGPFREGLDPAQLRIVRVPGTSTLVVLHAGVVVGLAHVDEHGNVGVIDVNERFAAMVERFNGKAAL